MIAQRRQLLFTLGIYDEETLYYTGRGGGMRIGALF